MKFWRHLLLAGGLLLVAGAVLVIRSWDTFALMMDNLAAMREGGEIAREIQYPADLLPYLAAHPERVSLVAYDVGAEADGIFFQADRLRPLVRVPHLLLLAEYARRAEAGVRNPERRVPLDAIARYALPGAGADRHAQARTHWREQGYVAADSTVALRHVVTAIDRFGDQAAADWWIDTLGREQVEAIPGRFGLVHSEVPLPGSGLHLSWNHHAATGDVADRRARYETMVRTVYADSVYALARRLHDDADFRRRERARLRQRGTDLGIRDQRALARATYPRGTAAEYADWMRHVARGTLHSDSVSAFLQRWMERPVDSDSVQAEITAIGSKAGALPGIISFVGYVRRRGNRSPRVVVLFMEQLPIGLFYHLMQTGLDKGFVLQLFGDDAFFREVRMRLEGA